MKTRPSANHSNSYPRTRQKTKQASIKKVKSTRKSPDNQEIQSQTLSAGLAICLIGTSQRQKMYDSEYEEEVRKQAVMQEVLPDATMWKKWEATEAPLRQGRGWYPTLDRHFLELLVVSEIHCLSHPLSVYSNPTAEKVHRHASRVRRVACERIGAERLHAYCDRVKEAFEAYMQGGWGRGYVKTEPSDGEGEGEEGEFDDEHQEQGQENDEERGRRMSRNGSTIRNDGPPSPPKDEINLDGDSNGKGKDDGSDGEGDIKMVIHVSPTSPSPSLSTSDSDSEAESDTSLETASTGPTGFGFMEEGEGELMKIDLEGVQEVEEDEAEIDVKPIKTSHGGDGKVESSGQMEVDVVLGGNGRNVPTIQLVTPNDT